MSELAIGAARKLTRVSQRQTYRGFRGILHDSSFDDDAKTRFLEVFAETGRITHAAAAAGVTAATVRRHFKKDQAFMEASEEAKGDYRDTIMEAVYMHAVEGVEEDVLGGQFKDRVVTTKRVWDTRLLAIEAKRVNPEYRETGVSVNVNLGVLVVPAKMSIDEWEANVNKTREIDAGSD